MTYLQIRYLVNYCLHVFMHTTEEYSKKVKKKKESLQSQNEAPAHGNPAA